MFSKRNSARSIVQDSPDWKSRELDLSNRHRTTLNFGDLVPAYWQHVQPGDKLKMDSSGLFKLMPLLAPAFSRMKIKTEWFYVPLRQVSPPTVRSLQDFNPSKGSNYDSIYDDILNHAVSVDTLKLSQDQQQKNFIGFPCIPSIWLTQWLQGSTAAQYTDRVKPIYCTSNTAFDAWRSSSENLYPQLEDAVSFVAKFRESKLCSYLGLPLRITQMCYNTDVYRKGPGDFEWIIGNDGTFSDTPDGRYVYDKFFDLAFLTYPKGQTDLSQDMFNFLIDGEEGTVTFSTSQKESYGALAGRAQAWLGHYDITHDGNTWNYPTWSNAVYGPLTNYSNTLISLLPFQSYQKIFNDFYRDEKIQKDEIRYYPYAVFDNQQYRIVSSDIDTTYFELGSEPNPTKTVLCSPAVGLVSTFTRSAPDSQEAFDTRFMNNLFGLRRRNRSKDVVNTCLPDSIFDGSSAVAPSSFTANLFSKLSRFLLKKEMTGSTWAEWLQNFLGVNSNDYLNNNVIYLGGSESVIQISENIQTSESSSESAQGNRAGLANDFHTDKSIYFQVPDFGIVMCIVSAVPDDVDFVAGFDTRFEKWSAWQFNLPDLQNIGFSALKNRNVVFSPVDKAFDDDHLFDVEYYNNTNFGYQPFGIEHTFTRNLISGDMATSLRYWTQNPDFDFDFCGYAVDEGSNYRRVGSREWSRSQVALNFNLPSVGLRFQPFSNKLASQYYNNIFAVTNDESGDHIVCDMRFFVKCHRRTAFFTDAIEVEK